MGEDVTEREDFQATEQPFSCIDDLWLTEGPQYALLLASSISRDKTRFFYWTYRWAPWKVVKCPDLIENNIQNSAFKLSKANNLNNANLVKRAISANIFVFFKKPFFFQMIVHN